MGQNHSFAKLAAEQQQQGQGFPGEAGPEESLGNAPDTRAGAIQCHMSTHWPAPSSRLEIQNTKPGLPGTVSAHRGQGGSRE